MAKSKNIFFKGVADSTRAVLDDRYKNYGHVFMTDLGYRSPGQKADIQIRRKEDKKLLLSTNYDDNDHFVNKFATGEEFNVIHFDEGEFIGNESEFYPPGFTGQFGRSAAEALATRDFSGLTKHVLMYPAITKARNQINGDYGLLRKWEIHMTCGSIEQLDELDKILFSPLGNEVQVLFGNFTQSPINQSGWEDYVIFDWSWRYVEPLLIEITFKMVGPGNLVTAVDTGNSIEGIHSDHEFVYDYKYYNKKRKVQSLVDALDYDIQFAMHAVRVDDDSLVETVAKNNYHRTAFTFPVAGDSAVKRFDVTGPLGKKYEDRIQPLNISHNCSGFAVAYRMDAVPGGSFDATNELAGATGANDAVEIYYSLGYVVHRLINYWLLENGDWGDIAEKIKKTKYSVRAFAKKRNYLTSVDPLNILITSKEPFNNQCTFGEYYADPDHPGDPQSDTGEFAPLWSLERTDSDTWASIQVPDGMDFRIHQVQKIDDSDAKTLTARNLNTYSSIGGLGDYMLCENILISRNFLKSLDPNKKLWAEPDKWGDVYRDLSDDKIDVSKFLKAIFKKIKFATCDYVDLEMLVMSKNELFKNPIGQHDQCWIVNRNQDIKDDDPKICMFYTGTPKPGYPDLDTNVLKQNLQMKVPKDMAAEAWGRQTPGKTGGTNSKSIKQGKEKRGPKLNVLEKSIQLARAKLFESAFIGGAISNARAAVKGLYNAAQLMSSKASEESMPYPLHLDIHLQGVYGFAFGDYIGVNFIPNSYKKFAARTGQSIAFTVLEVTHEIEGDGLWITHLKTIARLKGGSGSVPTDTAIATAISDELIQEAIDADTSAGLVGAGGYTGRSDPGATGATGATSVTTNTSTGASASPSRTQQARTGVTGGPAPPPSTGATGLPSTPGGS